MGQSNVTINGEPLDKFIEAEQAKEIAQVHRADSRPFPIRKHAITKHERASGRSKSGQVIYQAGQKETHVIIAGIVFPWHVKAPYVRSGESILGGLEYNEASDEVKCHECGKWMRSIGGHVGRAHLNTSVKEYRRTHGLRTDRPITSPGYSRRRIELAKENLWSGERAAQRSDIARKMQGEVESLRRDGCKKSQQARTARGMNGLGFSFRPENANLTARCRAQVGEKIAAYAQEIGRTPTKLEIRAIGLSETTVRAIFGMRWSAVCASIGLHPRSRSHKAEHSDRISAGELLGVRSTPNNTWSAYFCKVYLGVYPTLFEAACARRSAEDRARHLQAGDDIR